MVRLLYIHPGSVPPPQYERHDRFHFLSQICTGDVLLPVWWRTSAEALKYLGAYPEFRRAGFTYHLLLDRRLPGAARALRKAAFFIRRARWLHHRTGAYDVVMTYGTNSTGIAAVLISRLVRAKLIVEIPGVPEDAYLFNTPESHRSDVLKHAIADRALTFVLRRAHRAKLLYPTQLAAYSALSNVPSSTFHNFVPVANLGNTATDEKYVLFLGHPWYLKGADLLIRAFRGIAAQVPDYRLKVVGHFPDPSHLHQLAEGCRQIEILPPVSRVEALAAISSCSVFVLPSRSEAMGRVLLEAMAAGKPIVASRVGGIPYYVRDGENGLLTAPGSITQLGTAILEVLQHPELARALGECGRAVASTQYDEHAFVRSFAEMLTGMGFLLPMPARPGSPSSDGNAS